MPVILNNLKLQQFRAAHKLTQEELAELAGISDRYEREMEAGRCRNPSIAVLYPLSQALHVSMEELVCEVKDTED